MKKTGCALYLCAGVILVWVAFAGSPAYGGCSDAKYFEAEKLYKQALSSKSDDEKIKLMESAFAVCPSHGNHAQGYYRLGRLYFGRKDKDKALQWLLMANRFPEAILGSSVQDLAQTNFLLGTLYGEQGNRERSLVHLNIYRSLSGKRDKGLENTLIANADSLTSVMYSPGTIKETMKVNKSVDPEFRKKLNRVEVSFDYAKAVLDEIAKERLNSLGEALQGEEFRGCRVFVEGHTDEAGTEKSNCRLGEQRAKAVCDYLKERWGLDGVNLVAASYGKSNPVVLREGHAKEDWQKIDRLNRRVAVWNAGAPEPGEKDIRVEAELAESPCNEGSGGKE